MTLARQRLFEAFVSPSALMDGADGPDPVDVAFEKGRAEGLSEGALVGRAQGVAEGRAEGFEAGRAAGLEAGRAEGRAEVFEARDAALAAVADSLRRAVEMRAEAERRFAAAAAAALRAALIAALPRLCRRGLAEEIAELAREFSAAAALGEATLRIAPEHEAGARAALGDVLASDAGRKIALLADPKIGPLAARLEWRDGLLEFDGEDAAERALGRLDAALSHAAEADGGAVAGEAALSRELV